MTENTTSTPDSPKRFHFKWVLGVLFRPRATIAAIAAQTRSTWLTPMLVITVATLARVITASWLRQQAALSSGPVLPPDFQYYSPEQQAQFMQAAQATSGPVFVYLFPVIVGLISIWLSWLLVSALLHLTITLLGGRGDTGSAINLVAWSSLPFALRELVRAGSMLLTRQLIISSGLSGFAPLDQSVPGTYLAALLSLIDIYLIWSVLLLIGGVKAANGLPTGKAISGVVLTLGLVIALQALVAFLTGRFGGLTIIRPFF